MKKKYLLTMMVISVAFIASCRKESSNPEISKDTQTATNEMISEKGQNPDEASLADVAARHNCSSYLYTESNATSQNEILCYKEHADGSLSLEGTYASGGNGVGIFNGLGLDSQGALAVSDNDHLIFAVNAGSNSISSFQVHNDGSLTLAYTVASGGVNPTSLCIHHHILYVLNNTSSSIHGYTVGAGGTMTPIANSNLSLSAANADAAQIAFSPNGDYLFVTERATNKITSYDVDANGLATLNNVLTATGQTPFGFCHARDNYMVVSNANVIAPGVPVPNGASCTSYSGSNAGNLNAQNGAVHNNQSASCWVTRSKYGRFTFISNTGSNSISSYYVSPWGSIYLIHPVAAQGAAPKDIVVAPDNYYAYVLNTAPGSLSIGGYHRSFLGDLVGIGTTTGLPPYAAGLVAL